MPRPAPKKGKKWATALMWALGMAVFVIWAELAL
jgi:hypothetical protein